MNFMLLKLLVFVMFCSLYPFFFFNSNVAGLCSKHVSFLSYLLDRSTDSQASQEVLTIPITPYSWYNKHVLKIQSLDH